MNYTLENLHKLPLDLTSGDIIFLIGDLGAGKTTLTKELFSRYSIQREGVRSPTYTYMQEYKGQDLQGKKQIFHHFDLYRLHDYDDFLNIGGQEFLENPYSIKVVEWPEILFGYIQPTYTIRIEHSKNTDDERQYLIEKHQ